MSEYNLKLTLRVKVEKKLNVGIGGLSPEVESDNPFHYVMRSDGTTVLAVPGSTLKGVLRTSLIRIANLLGRTDVSTSPNPEREKLAGKVDSEIFGAPGHHPSKITVEDTYLEGKKTEPLTHVRINDKSKTAEEGKLFRTSYLPLGEEFTVHISARQLSIEEARLLMAAILEMNYERIGRAGVVSVRIDKAKSKVPEEIVSDPIAGLIWGELGV